MSTDHYYNVAQVTPDYNTAEAATILRLRPQTLRKAYSVAGAYFGLRPRKAPNGRLLWNAQSVLKLARGDQ